MISFLLVAAAGNVAAVAPKIRLLILTGESDYPYHDWRTTTPVLRRMLEKIGRFDIRVAEEVRGITPATLASYDVLLLNYNGPRWGAVTESAVEEFLRAGKGMVALHSVSYGRFFGMEFNKGRWVASNDPGWPAYPDMIGSSWKPENIGHASRGLYTARWIDREHPISRGLPESFVADDELYHSMDLRPGARVLLTAFSDTTAGGTGKDEPVLWTVRFGKGRVVHTTMGHDLASMYLPGFVTAFCRSVEWAATGEVTLPAALDSSPALRGDAIRVLVVTGGHGFPASFFTLFEGYDDVRWTHAGSQAEAFTPRMRERFDVVVLHDMYENIGEAERANLKAYVEASGGVVSIHHSIVDYTSWPWWHEEVIGGKYFQQGLGNHPKSRYKDDVRMVVRRSPAASGHPIVRGVPPLVLEDEGYRGMWLSPKATVLMETDSADNDRAVVYVGPYDKARVVYIQMGHGDSTIRHPGYRRLVHNALLWTANRE
jgi:hypothetical protein